MWPQGRPNSFCCFLGGPVGHRIHVFCDFSSSEKSMKKRHEKGTTLCGVCRGVRRNARSYRGTFRGSETSKTRASGPARPSSPASRGRADWIPLRGEHRPPPILQCAGPAIPKPTRWSLRPKWVPIFSENWHVCFEGIVRPGIILLPFGVELETRGYHFLDLFDPWAQ